MVFGDLLIKLNFDVKPEYDMKLHVGDKTFWSIIYDNISEVFIEIISFGQSLCLFIVRLTVILLGENLKTLKFENLSLRMV